VERLFQLVPFEDDVARRRIVRLTQIRVHSAPHGPDCTRPALDPEDDALLRPGIVHAVEDALGEPSRARSLLHHGEDTIARVLSKLFSFLFQRSTREERVAQYVIREHSRGRPLKEILEDHYVINRLTTPEQRARLLDRPEILHAFGEDIVSAAKTDQTS